MDTAAGQDRADWLEERAYHIWQKEGCPEGQSLRHWQQAEEDLCEAERKARLQARPERPPHVARRRTEAYWSGQRKTA